MRAYISFSISHFQKHVWLGVWCANENRVYMNRSLDTKHIAIPTHMYTPTHTYSCNERKGKLSTDLIFWWYDDDIEFSTFVACVSCNSDERWCYSVGDEKTLFPSWFYTCKLDDLYSTSFSLCLSISKIFFEIVALREINWWLCWDQEWIFQAIYSDSFSLRFHLLHT